LAENSDSDFGSDRVLRDQESGVIAGFRLVKSLLRQGYADRKLSFTIFTFRAQLVCASDHVDPTHAGVHGFAGSLAKEYPQWQTRLVDLASTDCLPLPVSFALPFDPEGNAWAYRNGEWYRQALIPARLENSTTHAWREQGVFIVIGGAGGIG